MTTATKPAFYIQSGNGFDVAQDFARAAIDTPIWLAESEHAKPGFVIGYIAQNPASKLGFLRIGHDGKVRVHVRYSALRPVGKMTLAHFEKIFPFVSVDDLTTGAKAVFCQPQSDAAQTLHALTDWAVSSNNGVSYIICPR